MTLARQDTQLETERLLLRRMTQADLPFFTRIHADPDVARYIGLGRPRSVEESRIWLEKILYTYDTMELGQLAVVRKADRTLIGRSGVSFLEIDPAPLDGGAPLGYFVPGEAPAGVATHVEGELGYTFDRAAWGQGFAREAAGAVFDYARRMGKRERIVSLIDPANARSHRVATSLRAVLVDGVRRSAACSIGMPGLPDQRMAPALMRSYGIGHRQCTTTLSQPMMRRTVPEIVLLVALAGCVGHRRPPIIAAPDSPPETGTFSIIAYDSASGEWGGAVQSRVFSVGNGVLWAEAGVGVVATQAVVDVSYGPQALALLREGKSATEVVKTSGSAIPIPTTGALDEVRPSVRGRRREGRRRRLHRSAGDDVGRRRQGST